MIKSPHDHRGLPLRTPLWYNATEKRSVPSRMPHRLPDQYFLKGTFNGAVATDPFLAHMGPTACVSGRDASGGRAVSSLLTHLVQIQAVLLTQWTLGPCRCGFMVFALPHHGLCVAFSPHLDATMLPLDCIVGDNPTLHAITAAYAIVLVPKNDLVVHSAPN